VEHVKSLVSHYWNSHNGNTPVECLLCAQQSSMRDK
jgi:hypothetical protein